MFRLSVLIVLYLAEIAFGAPGSYSGNVDAIDPDYADADGNYLLGAALLLLLWGGCSFVKKSGMMDIFSDLIDAKWKDRLFYLFLLCLAVFMATQILAVVAYLFYEWWWFFAPLSIYLLFKKFSCKREMPPP